MKKLLYIPVLMIAAILLSFATTQTEIDKTNAATKTFLLEMNDARMMDLEEGKQAAQKGTTNEVRQYGEKMIKEQTYLLKQFQLFAFSKKIELPKSISDKKLNALNDLKEKTGKDLDVPGSELDDDLENVGSEDEENNYYSIGGDDHDDLEENKG